LPADCAAAGLNRTRNVKLSVVVCAYNEKDTILTVLDCVRETSLGRGWEKEIIVVDNCSTDGTRELLKSVKADNVKVLFHPRNLGKGASIRTALAHCTGDYAIIQDADLEYDPAEIPLFLKKAVSDHADAVYGSRTLKGNVDYIYARNYWGVRFLTSLTNLLFRTRYTDVATASKMVRTSVLRALNLRCSGFDLDFELSNKLGKAGCRVAEIPVTYRPRSIAEGKKIRTKDGLIALLQILKDRFLCQR
jgi:dolichol-phosphate mannosyltransferase